MQIINNTSDFQIGVETAVVIGKFDGIHLGHQKLLNCICAQKEKGMTCVVFTFYPAPAVFFGQPETGEITTMLEKRRLFAQMGVDILIEFPLNEITAAIPAERFIEEILVRKMQTRFLCAGTDLSFGAKGRGDYVLLKNMAKNNGYQVEILDKVMYEGREISSTYIREEVEKGNMETVSALLGRHYQVSGTVITGNRLGRTIGMPTVNLRPQKDKLLPPAGVYYSLVSIEKEKYRGITNIGYKPTVSKEPVLGVETYLYDFEGNLYGREITVNLLSFKRAEMKFSGISPLKEQMELDIAEGRIYFQ